MTITMSPVPKKVLVHPSSKKNVVFDVHNKLEGPSKVRFSLQGDPRVVSWFGAPSQEVEFDGAVSTQLAFEINVPAQAEAGEHTLVVGARLDLSPNAPDRLFASTPCELTVQRPAAPLEASGPLERLTRALTWVSMFVAALLFRAAVRFLDPASTLPVLLGATLLSYFVLYERVRRDASIGFVPNLIGVCAALLVFFAFSDWVPAALLCALWTGVLTLIRWRVGVLHQRDLARRINTQPAKEGATP